MHRMHQFHRGRGRGGEVFIIIRRGIYACTRQDSAPNAPNALNSPGQGPGGEGFMIIRRGKYACIIEDSAPNAPNAPNSPGQGPGGRGVHDNMSSHICVYHRGLCPECTECTEFPGAGGGGERGS